MTSICSVDVSAPDADQTPNQYHKSRKITDLRWNARGKRPVTTLFSSLLIAFLSISYTSGSRNGPSIVRPNNASATVCTVYTHRRRLIHSIMHSLRCRFTCKCCFAVSSSVGDLALGPVRAMQMSVVCTAVDTRKKHDTRKVNMRYLSQNFILIVHYYYYLYYYY